MNLKYYGTAAAEGIPAIFCRCETCQTARKLGGKNIRTRSQVLVDGRLLIDFPPDTYTHMLYGGLELPDITALLVTHAHGDHLCAEDFLNRYPHMAHGVTAPLRVHGTAAVMENIRGKGVDNTDAIECHEIRAFEPFQVDDFTVTALTANHDPNSGPVIYIIGRGGKTMLYGNDTGWFPDETWDYLARVKPAFDLLSLDCTGMDRANYRGYSHMSLYIDAEVRDRLAALGCAGPETICCAHHFSHNGGLDHDALVQAAAGYGFLVSYDGMEIAF